MRNLLYYIQIFLSVFLIIVVLVQSRGTGFARSSRNSASFTRRGLEKVVFKLTFILSALFIIVSVLQLSL